MTTPGGDGPDFPYRKIAAELRRRIAAGDITGQLPGVHALADEFGVSHMTVRKALDVLKDEGLIHAVRSLGTFVTDQPGQPGQSPAAP